MDESKRLRALLDERGIEYTICMPWNDTAWEHDGTHFTATERFGKIYLQISKGPLTPEQAIAATVGTSTDLSKQLREVHGLHTFAELFGFSWEDESDWSWHDVACAMADAIDATVGVGTCRYVPERTATIVKVPRQSHVALGHYECGGCGATIDAGDRFCRKCGARLEGANQ